MIAIPRSPNFSDNLSRSSRNSDALPCAVCGKAVANVRWMVHVHEGGASIVTEEEAATLDPAADMSFFPLGRDCYRKHPELQPYAYKVTDNSDYESEQDCADWYRQRPNEDMRE